MKNKRITTYFLKLIRNDQRAFKCLIDDFYLITDGYKLYKIYIEDMEINPALIKDSEGLRIVWEKAIKDSIKLEYSLSKRNLGTMCDKYINEENEIEVYLNPQNLDFFDNYNVELFGSGEFDPILVKENNVNVGIVLPLRMTINNKF